MAKTSFRKSTRRGKRDNEEVSVEEKDVLQVTNYDEQESEATDSVVEEPALPQPQRGRKSKKEEKIVEVKAEVVSSDEDESHSDASEERYLATVASSDEGLVSNMVGSGIGELDASDFEFARFKVLQAKSTLVEEGDYEAGEIVLQRGEEAFLLAEKPSKGKEPDIVKFTVLNLQKQYQEFCTFDRDTPPRMFSSHDEYKAEGLRLWGEKDEGSVRPVTLASLLIKFPEDYEADEDSELWFPYEFKGDLYAVAFYLINGKAYKPVARKFWTAKSRMPNGYFPTRQWQMYATGSKGKDGITWIPTVKDLGETSEEFLDFIENSF